MLLTCPCGIHGSIELFTADEHARRFQQLVDKLPPELRSITPYYLGLFRAPKRRIAWERACRLLEDLRALIDSGEVHRRGRAFMATPPLFAAAMQQMLDGRDRLDLPLANHNYLIAIIAGESPRAASAAEAASESLRQLASQQRKGSDAHLATLFASEEAARKRLGMPPMTDAERDQFKAKEMHQ